MPDKFTPKAPIALAKPGQVPGYGRLIRKDELHPDYAKAAPLAYANPGMPVVVHEWPTVNASDDDRKELYRYAADEVRIQLPLMNAADAAKELDMPDGVTVLTAPDGLERFQVSLTSKDPEAVRTYVVYHPNGRPVRKRPTIDEEALGQASNLQTYPDESASEAAMRLSEEIAAQLAGSGEALPPIDD